MPPRAVRARIPFRFHGTARVSSSEMLRDKFQHDRTAQVAAHTLHFGAKVVHGNHSTAGSAKLKTIWVKERTVFLLETT